MSPCETGLPDWTGVTLATFNQSILQNPRLCNACICPLEIDGYFLGYVSYFPSLPGNALFAAIFGVCLLLQLFFGIRYRTWGFLICMAGGLVLEIIGYCARVVMRDNMFTNTFFVIYLVCLTIGPAFFSAAIYLTLSRLVVIYAPDRARFRPQVYTHIFIGCDVVALILQAAGGAIASLASPTSPSLQAGINTMVAGVAWQVFSLALFSLFSFEFWMHVRDKKQTTPLNPVFADLRARRGFQPNFIVAVFVAGGFIFVRSVFRCAELSGGFSGPLANEEVTFMILEGSMIILACITLTAFHPGLVVGRESWTAASRKVASVKERNIDADETGSSGGGPEKTESNKVREREL